MFTMPKEILKDEAVEKISDAYQKLKERYADEYQYKYGRKMRCMIPDRVTGTFYNICNNQAIVFANEISEIIFNPMNWQDNGLIKTD